MSEDRAEYTSLENKIFLMLQYYREQYDMAHEIHDHEKCLRTIAQIGVLEQLIFYIKQERES